MSSSTHTDLPDLPDDFPTNLEKIDFENLQSIVMKHIVKDYYKTFSVLYMYERYENKWYRVKYLRSIRDLSGKPTGGITFKILNPQKGESDEIDIYSRELKSSKVLKSDEVLKPEIELYYDASSIKNGKDMYLPDDFVENLTKIVFKENDKYDDMKRIVRKHRVLYLRNNTLPGEKGLFKVKYDGVEKMIDYFHPEANRYVYKPTGNLIFKILNSNGLYRRFYADIYDFKGENAELYYDSRPTFFGFSWNFHRNSVHPEDSKRGGKSRKSSGGKSRKSSGGKSRKSSGGKSRKIKNAYEY
jgi:hypothetical protein